MIARRYKYGDPLSADNIGGMIQCQSRRTFGFAFGPHRFRHCLGTTAPLKDPKYPGVAAAILGISGRMVEEHYNRARQAEVANSIHTSLHKQRANLRSLAERSFRQRRKWQRITFVRGRTEPGTGGRRARGDEAAPRGR
jgi:hypothetical protein